MRKSHVAAANRSCRYWVTNGCVDNMSGTSEVPKLPDPLCATRKSAEVGWVRTFTVQQETLITIAADPKHLHTWGSGPGGGISLDGTGTGLAARWRLTGSRMGRGLRKPSLRQ
jgi:hypothetical protein